MSIDPAILRAMAAAGASLEVILAAVDAAHAMEEARLAERRAKDAARQRKSRANRELSRDVTVTARDNCDSGDEQKNVPPHPPIENNSTPSPPTEALPLSRGRQTRGTRLPVDWLPSKDDLDFGVGLGFSVEEQLGSVVPEFRDYWCPLTGAKATKLDWGGTYRNRLRDLAKRRPRDGPRAQSQRKSAQSHFLDIARDADTELRNAAHDNRSFDGEILPPGLSQPSSRYGGGEVHERPGSHTGPATQSHLRVIRSVG